MARIMPAPRGRTARGQDVVTRRKVTANTALGIGDGIVEVDATAGAVAVTVPGAATMPAGAQFTVIKVAGGNDVTLNRTGADTIAGAGANYGFAAAVVRAATIEGDGISAWSLVGNAIP